MKAHLLATLAALSLLLSGCSMFNDVVCVVSYDDDGPETTCIPEPPD